MNLSVLNNFCRLRKLTMQDCGLDAISAESILSCSALWNTIVELDLNQNNIGSVNLSNLSNFNDIEVLHMSYCSLEAESINYILGSEALLKTLEEISLGLSWNIADINIETLNNFKKLRKLQINGSATEIGALNKIPGNSAFWNTLQEIILYFKDSISVNFEFLKYFKRLERLEIHYCNQRGDDFYRKCLSKIMECEILHRTLKILKLDGVCFYGSSFGTIPESEIEDVGLCCFDKFESLEELILQSSTPGSESFNKLMKCKNLHKTVKVLNVENLSSIDLKDLGAFERLRKLSVVICGRMPAWLAVILNSENLWHTLEELKLINTYYSRSAALKDEISENNVSDEKNVDFSKFKRLSFLDLKGTIIGPVLLDNLMACESLQKTLKYLYIYKNNIEGANLAMFSKFRRLEGLCLIECGLVSQSLKELIGTKGPWCTSLKLLSLYGNDFVNFDFSTFKYFERLGQLNLCMIKQIYPQPIGQLFRCENLWNTLKYLELCGYIFEDSDLVYLKNFKQFELMFVIYSCGNNEIHNNLMKFQNLISILKVFCPCF